MLLIHTFKHESFALNAASFLVLNYFWFKNHHMKLTRGTSIRYFHAPESYRWIYNNKRLTQEYADAFTNDY